MFSLRMNIKTEVFMELLPIDKFGAREITPGIIQFGVPPGSP
jgi:hypothetical protein